MAESQEERNERVGREYAEQVQKDNDEAQKWAEDNREDQALAPESEEEAADRVASVRRTMVFGDTGTDVTTGDAGVPVADAEQGTVSQAEADVAADEGDEEAEDMSLGEKQRQSTEGLDEEDLAAVEDSEEATDDDGFSTGETEGEAHELSATEKVAKIREADSADEVDELVGDDKRVSVTRAADARKKELED